MEKVIQEIIQWTIENSFNVTSQCGTHLIVVDHEEMSAKFDDWLEQSNIDWQSIREKFSQLEQDIKAISVQHHTGGYEDREEALETLRELQVKLFDIHC